MCRPADVRRSRRHPDPRDLLLMDGVCPPANRRPSLPGFRVHVTWSTNRYCRNMTAGTGWWKGPARRLRDSAVWNPPLTSAAKSVLMASRQPPPDWLVARVPRIGYARATLPNGTEMVMHAREHDHISTGVFWRGWTAWEPELLPIWFGAASRAVNVIDVGAHVGERRERRALRRPPAEEERLAAGPAVTWPAEASAWRTPTLGEISVVKEAFFFFFLGTL